jgi:hypothetical protein
VRERLAHTRSDREWSVTDGLFFCSEDKKSKPTQLVKTRGMFDGVNGDTGRRGHFTTVVSPEK